MKILCIALLSIISLSASAQQHRLVKLWETDTVVRTPESVLPDFRKKVLYVSQIDGDANTKDGKGGVAILGLDGKIKNLSFITGLNAPKGLGQFGNTLYIADLTEVVKVNILTGKIEKKIPVEGSRFLNDITVDDKGVVYVSDTRVNIIYRLEKDKVSTFLPDVAGANGLKAVGNNLYILSGPNFVKVDKSGGNEAIIAEITCSGDGLEPVGNGDFIASCWSGYIFYITAAGKVEQLLDVHGGKMNTADFGYDAKNRTLFVPTFNGNQVIAYKLETVQ